MPDASTDDPQVEPPAAPVSNVSGGVNVDANQVAIGGDVVGRDKLTMIGFTVEQVSTLLTQISSTFQPKPFDGRCPYLGLDAFSEDDADRFFGRETLVSDLVARVKESRSLVIAGPSGCGKSSLVRAGLIHALKQGTLPSSDRWLYVTLTPGRDPIESLALAMSRLAKSPDAGKYLRDHSAETNALHVCVESQLSDRKDQRAIVFVDQFEETFTQVSKEDERVAFLNLLTWAATIDSGHVTVLFALRSDFVSNCATYPQLNALLNQQFMQVGAMQSDELVSAIARPALQVGLRIDPDLVAQVVNDMQDAPGALPLMEFALKDLFDAQQTTGSIIALTRDDYLSRGGGLKEALARHAETEYGKLSPAEQVIAQIIMTRLVSPGKGTEYTRRAAYFQELVPATITPVHVQTVIAKLEDARLITTEKDEEQEKITLTHERLIEAWPRLRRLVNENRDAIALQNQIAEDAQEWDEHQRDVSYLYSGTRLAIAREELAGQRIALSEPAQHFVSASVEAEESGIQREKERQQTEIRRLRIRNRIITAISGLVLLVAIVAIFLGMNAYQQQRLSRSRELTVIAQSLSDKDPKRSILIAAEAAKAADTYEAQDVLRTLLLASRLKTALRGHQGAVYSAQFSPDGQKIVTASADKTARVWDAVSGKELAVLQGHNGGVNSAHFSPDGRQIVTVGDDWTARVWDAATGAEVAMLRGHEGTVGSAEFSPDGQHIVTASYDGTAARVWDAATGRELAELPHAGPVTDAHFSPDGQQIVTAGGALTAQVWDWVTGTQLVVLDTPWPETHIAQYSPNGRWIVTASPNGTARVWDAATGKEVAMLQGNGGIVRTAQFSPDSLRLVTTSADGTAQVWDIFAGKQLALLHGSESVIYGAQFSPDGQLIVTAAGCDKLKNETCTEGAARIWDAATGKELAVLRGHGGPVYGAEFSPDGNQIVTASEDNTAQVWFAVMEGELAVLQMPMAPVISEQFSPDGRQIVTTGCGEEPAYTVCTEAAAWVWDVATGRKLAVLRGHEDTVNSAQYSPDGRQIVTASADKTARVWDAATGKQLAVLQGHLGEVDSAQYSRDGRQIITWSGADGTIRVWDAATGSELTALRKRIPDPAVVNVAFSPDAHQIVTLDGDGTVQVWDIATDNYLAALRIRVSDRAANSAHFSPNARRLVFSGCGRHVNEVCTEGAVWVWDPTTGEELIVLRGHEEYVYDGRFSPDGQRIVTASADGTARVWDAATGKEMVILRGHEGAVDSAQYSPDGQQIVTASADGTARVWDAATGKEQAVLRGNTKTIPGAQFSPDGKYILSVGGDGVDRVYLVHIEDLIALAQSRVTALTCQERVQLMREDVVCPSPMPQLKSTPNLPAIEVPNLPATALTNTRIPDAEATAGVAAYRATATHANALQVTAQAAFTQSTAQTATAQATALRAAARAAGTGLAPWRKSLAGVAMGNAQPFNQEELKAIADSQVEAVLLLTLADPDENRRVVSELRRIRPDMIIVARLHYSVDVGNKTKFSAQDFVGFVMNGMSSLYEEGVRYFEVHYEPNLENEGMGWNWITGADFGTWFLQVYDILKREFPSAQFGFPGLSLQSNTSTFLEASTEAIEKADWIGVHTAWRSVDVAPFAMTSEDVGMYWKQVRERFPDKLIMITGFSNNDADTSYVEKGRQYAQYYQMLRNEPYIGAAFSFAVSWPGLDNYREGWVFDNKETQIPTTVGGLIGRPGFLDGTP